MDVESDRRLWSITARGLSECLSALFKRGIQSSSIRELQKNLRENAIYPARDFAHLCSPEPPDVFFTYDSRQNFVEIQEIVWQTFDFAAMELRKRRPDLIGEDLEPLISDGIRLWVDFVFIDQSARDIRQELTVLPQLVNLVKVHYVLGSTPLERAWCCYEIALFNQQCVSKGNNLKSFIAPMRTIYFGWDAVLTTEVEDKLYIEQSISSTFPNGLEGFTEVMNQANAVAVLALTEGAVYYTPDSMNNLWTAVEKWYDRS